GGVVEVTPISTHRRNAADQRQEPRGAPTEGLARGAMGAHTYAKTMPDHVRLCARVGQRFMFAAVLFVPLLQAGVACAADTSAVYRFYNTRTATHFYTILPGERDAVIAQYPWFVP